MSTAGSRYDDSADRPLFGEPQPRMVEIVPGSKVLILLRANSAQEPNWPPEFFSVFTSEKNFKHWKVTPMLILRSKMSKKDRMLNLIVGVFTSIIVVVTLISAFIFPPGDINGVNVFFACIIVLICGSHLFLIYWYRQGDLEPKFRKMIIYNAFSIILLCLCGNLYIHGLGIKKKDK